MAENIRRLLAMRISLPFSAPPHQRANQLSHGTRLLLMCRELADNVSEIRRTEIAKLQDQLRSVWDTRTITLADLSDAVVRAETTVGNVNSETWESRLPVLSARAEMARLFSTSVSARLCQRLRTFALGMVEKVQRPLPVRPRGAREQRQRVIADLEELVAACDAPLNLESAWLHLPCVLWSETYVELVDSVNTPDNQPKRHASDPPQPSAKRVK